MSDKPLVYRGIFDWKNIMLMKAPEVPFFLEPYIPQHGITVIHGKWGTYKTPLTLNMAMAISRGEDIWGLKVTQARQVLYVEMDTPCSVLLPRIHKLNPEDGTEPALHGAFFQPGPDVIKPSTTVHGRRAWEDLFRAHNGEKQENGSFTGGLHYDLIFFDSLRCLHGADDKGSETPHILYNALMDAFPGAALVLVHHDRKSRADDTATMSAESFSGSQAWINHATVAVHVRHGDKDKNQIVLEHTKSQASELVSPLVLKVEEGIKIQTAVEASRVDVMQAFETLERIEPGLSTTMKEKRVAVDLGVSVRTVQRRRKETKEADSATAQAGQAEITH